MPERIWITIPGGEFHMGSDPRDSAPPNFDEFPLHRVELPAFYLSRKPVSNEQYARFVEATGHPAPAHWIGGQQAEEMANLPVTYVTWADAAAFCAWAGGRLPTEAEWEKAARGPATSTTPRREETRWWPWGDKLPQAHLAHFGGQSQGVAPSTQGATPVGSHPDGASPYGLLDMAGNVWEWTSSIYRPYPWRPEADGHHDSSATVVVRGGTFNHPPADIRCSARQGMVAGVRDVYIGFRIAFDDRGAPRIPLDLAAIPAGPFWMGNDPGKRASLVLPDELPRHLVELPPFEIAQTPVTNAEYRRFVRKTGHPAPPHWPGGDIPDGLEGHPVTHVDWRDAIAYCEWAGVRLPTEAEWERAAAGRTGRLYPWGDDLPSADRLNMLSSEVGTTTPVDQYPAGATPEGVLDMAGNVWEWVSSRYGPYPVESSDNREALDPPGRRVLRGGSFLSPSAGYVRCAMRSLSFESRRREHIGFRVARSLPAGRGEALSVLGDTVDIDRHD